MDMMFLAIMCFTVVSTMSLGYLLIQKIYPHENKEINASKAFDIEDYQTVCQITESIGNKPMSLNMYLLGARARVYLELFDEAQKWFEMALGRCSMSVSDRVFIETELADICMKQQKLENAEIHYRTALELNPKHEIANYKLAVSLYTQKKYDKTRKILKNLLHNNPRLADARRLYAETLACLGQFNHAIRHYGILSRAGEKIGSYNYARTLKFLKIHERAYETYKALLSSEQYLEYKEELLCDLVDICLAMHRYAEGLNIIDDALGKTLSVSAKRHLEYVHATLLYHRGDEMTAFEEYHQLYQQYPNYRDLSLMNEKFTPLLEYPYFFRYFTSNTSVFERTINQLIPSAINILRRTSEYYVGISDNNVFVFYRRSRPISKHLINELDLLIAQLCTEISALEIWAFGGVVSHYTTAGANYRCIVRSGDDFRMRVQEAVVTIETGKSNFEQGLHNVSVLEIVDADEFMDDPILERAFSK